MAKLSDPAGYLAEHYTYELDMLRWTHASLDTHGVGNWMHKGFENALIESYCIHARTLVDFFEKKPRKSKEPDKPDDVAAADYGLVIPAKPVVYKTPLYTKLNWQIAHLTTGRIGVSKIGETDRNDLRAQIERMHAQFVEVLSKDLARSIPPIDPSWITG